MNTIQKEKFDIVGIKTRTINDGSAGTDIPALWNKFMGEGISSKVANKVDETIYCLYTGYEGDHTKPYDVVLGYKVTDTDNIPNDLTHLHVPESKTSKFVAKGSLVNGGAVVETWIKVWNANLDRSYAVDYEVYDERSADMNNAEVDIFISLK